MDKEDKAGPENLRNGVGPDEGGPALQAEHKDVLAEAGDISMGAAATALSHLLNKRVEITTPEVSLVSMNDVRVNYPVPCLVITVNYLEGLQGENIFVIREDDALTIAGLVMGMEAGQGPAKMGEMEMSALGEAMNQMMGSAATAMSEFLNCFINISPPAMEYKDLQIDSMEFTDVQEESKLIQIAFRLVIEDFLDSELLQLSPLNFGRQTAARLLAELLGEDPGKEAAATATGATAAAEPPPPQPEVVREQPVLKAAAEPPAEGGAGVGAGAPAEAAVKPPAKKEVRIVPPAPVPGQASPVQPAKTYGLRPEEFARINLIRDIPVEISAILGRASLPLNKVFSLAPGETLSLDSYLGEPVELLADERPVAIGEVVLVNGKFGVKIVKVIGSGSGSGGDL